MPFVNGPVVGLGRNGVAAPTRTIFDPNDIAVRSSIPAHVTMTLLRHLRSPQCPFCWTSNSLPQDTRWGQHHQSRTHSGPLSLACLLLPLTDIPTPKRIEGCGYQAAGLFGGYT
jgi:hypothetical protein